LPLLIGAALFLNPNKFFELQRNDPTKRELGKLRAAFNEVLWKMVVDDELQYVISKQADEYMNMASPAFSSPLAIREQQKRAPFVGGMHMVALHLRFNPLQSALLAFVVPLQDASAIGALSSL